MLYMRTSAAQCCHHQHLIDKAIPIYWAQTPPATSSGAEDVLTASDPTKRMSILMISDKARKATNPSELNFITPTDPFINCDTGLPYVTILLDMGLDETAVDSTFNEPTMRSLRSSNESKQPPSLRIHARGLASSTYPFLDSFPGMESQLRQIVFLAQRPQMTEPFATRLRAQFEVLTQSTDLYTRWDIQQPQPVKGQ